MTSHSPIRAASKVTPQPTGEARFAFLLLDGFTHLAFASALEPLRVANEALGRPAYGWRLLSETGGPVTCSNGMTILADGPMQPMGRGETLIVVGGRGARRQASDRLLGQLRREAVRGTRIGALCMGSYILARAGLLEGEECAVHWELADAFAEEFPRITVTRAAFTLGRRPTAPGGAVAADLMLHLIAADHGAELPARLADLMVCNGVRSPQSDQTVSLQSRYGMRNPRLVKVLRFMEQTLEQPLTAAEIAEAAGMSIRQTERLFTRYVKMTPMAFYARLRLDKAHSLLMQTELSITEVAVACGFQSSSHFAKRYRAAFGVNPRHMRVVGAPAAA